MALRLIFLGPPGVGKGTQAALASAAHGIPQISTGDMLRETVRAGTELGRMALGFMNQGALVPDEVVLGIVAERIGRPDCRPGFILDGFPRTAAQAEGLDSMLTERQMPLSGVVSLEVPEDELVHRLSLRWVCPACGRTYPDSRQEKGGCEADGERLLQRSDDRPEVVMVRLGVYRDQTRPLLSYYTNRGLLRKVDGLGAVRDVTGRVEAVLAGLSDGKAG